MSWRTGFFTLAGIVLLMGGGYGMVFVSGMHLFGPSWLIWGQALFLIAGLVWLFVLVPLQMRQSKAARSFISQGQIPDSYHRQCRLWLFWGIVATIPLVAATYVMIAQP